MQKRKVYVENTPQKRKLYVENTVTENDVIHGEYNLRKLCGEKYRRKGRYIWIAHLLTRNVSA